MFARKNSADMVLSHPKDIGNARLRPSSISQFSNGFYVAWCKFWRTAIYPSVLSILGWCSPIKILKRTIRSTIIFVTCKKTIWAWAYKYFQKQYMQWSHVLFSRCGMLTHRYPLLLTLGGRILGIGDKDHFHLLKASPTWPHLRQ
jgi:hypothetical protein